jgi:molybdenum cofactor sulfurtransferase
MMINFSLFKKKIANSANQIELADDAFFEDLRKREFSRLDEEGHVYLDFTGGGLYTASQIVKHQQQLLRHVFGNPHSTNPTSLKATELVEEARNKVLDYFNASDYYCVFTQNASGALKIVGESFPFAEGSQFVVLADNHNSVNGIREFCNFKKGNTTYVPVQYEDLEVNSDVLLSALKSHQSEYPSLFAFPAQSNVSGVKHDLNWINIAQQMGYRVLLDAAAFVPTSILNLKEIQPDFVSVSFYKIFGYPTGIGCLLIKKSSFELLQKPWFAGGTVTMVSVAHQNKFLAHGHERFEDGTLNYNNIPAIKIGLEFVESIGMKRINTRVRSLIEYITAELRLIKHDNGNEVVKIFGPRNFDHRGGNIIVNFFNAQGEMIPYAVIEGQTNEQMISIRSGCFCNPGIDEINYCISTEDMASYFMSRDHGGHEDIKQFLGKMRGAIRISVGMATVRRDIDKLIGFVKTLRNKHE